jgi:AAA domain
MSDPRNQLDALLPPDPGAGRTEPLSAISAGSVSADLPRHLRDRLDEAPGPDRSAQTAGLVVAAVEWGLDDGQVVALALAHRPTREKYGKRVEKEVARLLGKFRPDHQHLGRPCDRAGCPNTPRWMAGPPAEPVPVRPAGSAEPQEGAPVDLLAGLRDGAWLDAQHFPPLAYMVPGLIPEGSVLLVGPPKIGKSWLVLTVALAAAVGGKALGITIPKRPVLYLALEDGDRRLQDRCRKLLRGDPIPREFEYLLQLEQGRAIDTITAWLNREYDLPPLVILDTLGKVMPPALPGEMSYQRDYRIGTTLKRIADDHPGMCLLTNHHDRKAGAEDWVDSVSGTHGLAGAADTVIVLTRARHATSGRLKVTGRDVPEGEYALTVADGFAWDLDGADLEEAAARAREARLTDGVSDRSAEIIAFVAANPPSVRAGEVEDKFGPDGRRYLKRLADSGRLRKLSRGIYTSVPSVPASHSQVSEGEQWDTGTPPSQPEEDQ